MEQHKRPIAIFDVDGTLLDPTQRRKFVEGEGKKDWDAFFDPENVMKDKAISQVVMMAQLFSKTHDIHVVTARRESDRDITLKQLDQAKVPFTKLHITRQDGNRKPDEVIKREWLRNFEGRDRIDFVVDDRLSVVWMWRSEGLFVFQVGSQLERPCPMCGSRQWMTD